jgi:integrase
MLMGSKPMSARSVNAMPRTQVVLRRAMQPTLVDPADALHFDAPVIDWDYLIDQRRDVIGNSEDLPPYLLRPEVHNILNTIERKSPRDANSFLLFATLWNTGARISEALALTKNSFHLDARGPYVSLKTLKKRGRPTRLKRASKNGISREPVRRVPIRNPAYLESLQAYFELVPLRGDARIFNISRQAADTRIRSLVGKMNKPPSIEVSCHTFRHSFAVNCLLHGISLGVLQHWLGHANIESTVVYTQVLTLETGHLIERVAF